MPFILFIPLCGALLIPGRVQAEEPPRAAPAPSAKVDPMGIDPSVIDQPESVSCGSTNRGALSDAAMLPNTGFGYVMANPWRSRGHNFGTRELVGLIVRSAASVARQFQGSTLSVADMSGENGGALSAHRSHQNGRDMDLIYYAMNAKGQPIYPDSHMAYYSSQGVATYAKAPRRVNHIPIRYFDLARNWALVRTMLYDKEVEVEHIFVSTRVQRWLLQYAVQIKESASVIKRAKRILHPPTGVKGHNDHMHVRISCSISDTISGRCRSISAKPPAYTKRWNRSMPCPKPVEAPVLPAKMP